MKDEIPKNMNVEDAIRLKNQLDHEILKGGLNAQEITNLEELSNEQYAGIKKGIAYIKENWWFFPDFIWWIGLILGTIGFFYFQNNVVQIVFVSFLLYSLGHLAYRQGVYYGFTRGYEDGHVIGVRKVLKIDEKEAREIRERAIEMEMDDKLINSMDERRSQMNKSIVADKGNGGNEKGF